MGTKFSNISGGVGGVNIANDGSTIHADGSAKSHAKDRARVFLCHASEDKQVATSLKSQLESAGHAVWLDSSALKGGDDWPKVIARAIAQADVVAVLVSPSLIATDGFARREIELATATAPNSASGARVIPLLLCSVQLPEPLARLHAIDLRRKDGVDRLLLAVARGTWD